LPTLSGVDCTVTSPPYNQMEGIANRAPSGMWADKSGGLGLDVPGALIEKNRFNKIRPDHDLGSRAAGGKKY
jgi:hypothetical protein